MAIEHLVKGEPDWHTKMNNNMDSLQEDISQAKTDAENASNTKVDKPTESTMTEGYLYQNADGTTRLVDGGDQTGKFKYSIIVDNGLDGSPDAVEYADDCAGFVEARGQYLGDWSNTRLVKEYFRPCVIAPGDGSPKYYLQQDNMALKENGETAVLTGADGDVMIEVKKLYAKFSTNSTHKVKISLMNYKEDDSCICFNDIAGVEKDVIYRGAFKAGVASGAGTIMRSIAGVAPLVSITRATGRTYAKNRGEAYHQNNIYMLFLWQLMYLLLYKNRDSQTVLGQGRSLSSNTAAANTGWSISKPFCWGDQGGVNGVKFLGVEDFYGNVWEWVDGIVYTSNVYKLTRNPDIYNDTGDGYEIAMASGMTAANNNDKYITSLACQKDAPFVPIGSGGSSSTFWCDNVWIADGVQVVRFGGCWTNAAKVGAFCWTLDYSASSASAYVGSRLCRE